MKASEVSMEHLVTDLKAVARDGEELLHASASDLGDAASALRERLSKSLESARSTCRRLQEKTAVTARKAGQVAHDHPYRTAGVAFGIGVLLGVLVNLRMRNGGG